CASRSCGYPHLGATLKVILSGSPEDMGYALRGAVNSPARPGARRAPAGWSAPPAVGRDLGGRERAHQRRLAMVLWRALAVQSARARNDPAGDLRADQAARLCNRAAG